MNFKLEFLKSKVSGAAGAVADVLPFRKRRAKAPTLTEMLAAAQAEMEKQEGFDPERFRRETNEQIVARAMEILGLDPEVAAALSPVLTRRKAS